MTNEGTVKYGLMLGFGAFALFSLSDASAKFIKGALPPFETAFFGAFFGLVILPFLQEKGDKWTAIFETSNRSLWLLRFGAYPIGVMGSVTAFTHLPMAEAFVLMFLQPTYVTIISVLFLGERVGFHRWFAVAVGLLGVVVALHPGIRTLSIGHFGAILAGLGGAVSVVTFRVADRREKRVSLFGAGILGGISVCFVAMIPAFRPPSPEEMLLLASYGLLAAFANLVLMHSTEFAPAAWVAPTQYSQMLWAVVLGYFLFGNYIDLATVSGVGLIIGSGVLTLQRETINATPLPPAIAVSTPHVGAALVPARARNGSRETEMSLQTKHGIRDEGIGAETHRRSQSSPTREN